MAGGEAELARGKLGGRVVRQLGSQLSDDWSEVAQMTNGLTVIHTDL
jgi:hypothetical protein